jgi:uncharacterized protein with HEPN domain
MLDAIRDLEIVIGDKNYDEFISTVAERFASVKLFEIIGEASMHISDTLKEQHNTIQWNEIKGMRNILVHEYFGVSYETVYDTYKNYLPVLKQQLLTINI